MTANILRCILLFGLAFYYLPVLSQSGLEARMPDLDRSSSHALRNSVHDLLKAKLGETLGWVDPLMDSDEGRQQLVRTAYASAIKVLQECSQRLVVKEMLCMNWRSDCDNLGNNFTYYAYDTFFHKGKEDHTGKLIGASTQITCNYTPVPSEQKSYAYTNSTGRTIHNAHLLNQRFNNHIEITPHVFEDREFYMKSEENTPEGPYASSIKQALVFLILHEFAHIELYISRNMSVDRYESMHIFQRNRRLNLSDEEEEVWADQWASDILRCY